MANMNPTQDGLFLLVCDCCGQQGVDRRDPAPRTCHVCDNEQVGEPFRAGWDESD